MMRDFGPETLEADLASLKPARMPEQLSTDLVRSLARGGPKLERRPQASLFGWLRWAIPVGSVAGLMVFFILGWHGTSSNKPRLSTPKSTPVAIFKPDAVLLSQELVANFEAVTRLPDGSPVRVRCEEWIDEVQLRDPARGVWVEHRKPRLEVHPVGYDTY